MRILLLHPGPSYRVSAEVRQQLELLSRDASGVVLTTSNKPWSDRVARFEVRAIYIRKGRMTALIDYWRAVKAVIREHNAGGWSFDLIVTYDPLRSGLVAALVRKRAGAKFICELNGDYGNVANYMDIPSPLSRKLKRWLYTAVANFVLRRTDGIKILYAGQLAAIGFKATTQVVRCYPCLVNTRAFINAGETPTIVSAGFPLWVKGMDLLIAAFQSVADKLPEWRLQIVGHYPDKSVLARACRGHPRIEVLDAVPQEELAKIVGRCGIFALASRTETMGRVLVEAMAAGKPRIGTLVGGVSTVIENKVDGLLVEPGNVEELANAILSLAKQPELRRQMGERARRRAADVFNPERWWIETKSHYASVVGHPKTDEGYARKTNQ